MVVDATVVPVVLSMRYTFTLPLPALFPVMDKGSEYPDHFPQLQLYADVFVDPNSNPTEPPQPL